MKVKKNRHYGTPFPFPHFFGCKTNRFFESKSIQFDDTIKYNIGEDQSDVNKLFGFSYGLHHTDSDRIGFRYIPETNNVQLVLYSYEKGTRLKTQALCNVEIGEKVTISLYVGLNEDKKREGRVKIISETRDVVVDVTFNREVKSPWLRYTLGLYFGGNRRAPHTININEWEAESELNSEKKDEV